MRIRLPVWARSRHTWKLDAAINRAMRTITGCMRFTPAIFLPVLAGLEPLQIRRAGCCQTLALKALEPKHLLHEAPNNPHWSVSNLESPSLTHSATDWVNESLICRCDLNHRPREGVTVFAPHNTLNCNLRVRVCWPCSLIELKFPKLKVKLTQKLLV